jgi:hypothetical protein
MEPKCLLPCLKQTSTGSYPEPDESNQHTKFVFLECEFRRVELNMIAGRQILITFIHSVLLSAYKIAVNGLFLNYLKMLYELQSV